MDLLDYESIRDFYNNHNNCWSSDLFSQMTTTFIDKYVYRIVGNLDNNSIILNAGSGGKIYKTCAKQFHLDIARNTLSNIENSFVGNVIDMPFEDNTFDCVICVGTVINYCEADKAIREINRVSKNDALLVLEYERSGSGLVMKGDRNADCIIFCHTYFGEPHRNLLYSDSYVRKLLYGNGYHIKHAKRFNTTIPWMEMFAKEELAQKMTIFEPFFRIIPFINIYSHNEIMICQKTSTKSHTTNNTNGKLSAEIHIDGGVP